MQSIPDGSTFTYVGTWPHGAPITAGFDTPANSISLVGNFLNQMGINILQTGSSGGSSLFSLIGSSFTVTLTLLLNNGMGYNSVADAISAVRGAVFQALGDFPTSDSIPQIQLPDGSKQTTGQPGTASTNVGQHVCGDPTWSFFDDPAQYIKCATTGGLSTLGLVFIGLALGIVLIVTFNAKRSAGV